MKIETPQGPVGVLEPTPELVRGIQTLLPFGLVGLSQPENGARCGLVMQCDQTELVGVKQQAPDCDKEQGLLSFHANSLLIAHSLSGYLAHGFSGLFLPCPYLRQKAGGRYESGIAYFGYPSAHGHEAQESFFEAIWAGHFGQGFTRMMTHFINALQQSALKTGITLSSVIGLDVRRRTQLGLLGFGFMVIGPHVVCLKTALSEQDAVWGMLRSGGIEEVYHLPSVPAAIHQDDLRVAKPGN